MQVEGIQVHADEGGVTQTRGGVYWLILPAGCNSLLPLKTRFLISVFLAWLWDRERQGRDYWLLFEVRI